MPCCLVDVDRLFRGLIAMALMIEAVRTTDQLPISAGIHGTTSKNTAVFIESFIYLLTLMNV
jgi:hypothetical protein